MESVIWVTCVCDAGVGLGLLGADAKGCCGPHRGKNPGSVWVLMIAGEFVGDAESQAVLLGEALSQSGSSGSCCPL